MKSDDVSPLTKEGMKESYYKTQAKCVILLVACVAGILLFTSLFSINKFNGISLSGTYEIIWNHICGNGYPVRSVEWWADRYIWNTALPHILAAILAGASLAVCGVMMQSIMSNPLADPYSTGISSGACLGAVTAIIVGATMSSVSGEFGIVTNAFIGALIPAVLIIILSQRIRMSPATLILLGTAISYFFNSMITYLMVTTDADTLQNAYMWQIGSLDGIGWNSIWIMAVVTIIGSAIVMLNAKKLNVMTLGDNSAKSLGIDVQTFRTACLVLMAFMTASIISFTGIIGFVGLVAPHIVRLIIGSDNRYVIPISMTFGAFLLLLADYLTLYLSNIPVGVIMGIIGAPVFFIFILWNTRKPGVIY